MRDKTLNVENYYDRFLKTNEILIKNSLNNINSNSIPIDNISNVWHMIFFMKFERLIAKFGRGDNLHDIKLELDKIFDNLENEWKDDAVKFKMGRTQKIFNQYWLNSYCYMIWLLSFSILLGISTKRITQLSNLIETGQIEDELILYLLSKLNDKKYNNSQPVKYSLFKKLYSKNELISDTKKMNKYLNSWHKNSKLFTWHNYINSAKSNEYYFGYWSFEAAAIIAINNLDDESLRVNQYYPGELVKYYKMNRKNG